MAFGDIKGTKTGSATSITASMPCATGTNFAVVAKDLIVALIAEELTVTATACTDNLGNTYTALGAGLDAGTVTGRGFYTRVTNAGTITGVTFTATPSGNNVVTLAVGFEGPFAASPLDAQPAGIINDNTTPYTCPATGVLAQADEKIVCAIVHNGNPTLTATAPNLKAVELNTAAVLKAAIGHQTVAATTSVTPAWTSSATPTASAYDTVTFKKDLSVTHSDSRAETNAIADARSGVAVTIGSLPETNAIADARDATVVEAPKVYVSWAELQAAAVESASRAESAAIADSAGTAWATAGSRDETAAIAETETAAAILVTDRAETNAIISAQSGIGALPQVQVSWVELQAVSVESASRAESAAIAETLSLVFAGSRQETAAIYDQVHREGESAGGPWIKHNGEWKQSEVFVKHNGAWKAATVYVKHDAAWKLVA